MSKIFVCIMFVFLAFNANSQSIQTSQVPQLVLSAFNSQYSNASNINWTNNSGNYTVTFKVAGTSQKAHYNQSGEWLFTEQSVTMSTVPGQISADINSRFDPSNFVGIFKETKPSGVEYRYEYKSGPNTIQVWYSEAAQILRRNIVQ